MPNYSRLCCIRNCLGPETPRNIYKFPNDENERNLWLNATKRYLRKNNTAYDLFICMRHFSDECLHSASYKIWKDGCEVDVQRKYRKLKKDSVPSIFEVNDEDSETEKTKTEDKKEKDENLSEDFKSVSIKYSFGNSPEINSNNYKKKLKSNETEGDGLQLSDFDIKKPPVKRRRRAKRKTDSNEIKLENLEKSKLDENSSQPEIPLTAFPNFTFANSDINNYKNKCEISLSKNDEFVKSATNNIVKIKTEANQVPATINTGGALMINPVQPAINSIVKIKTEANQLPATINAGGTLIINPVKQSINNIVKIKTEANQLPATINAGGTLIINPVKQSINNIVKIKTEANQLPGTINKGGTLIINPVNPAINNIVKLNTESNQLPTTINTGGTLIINRNDGIVISPTIAKITNQNQNSNTSQLLSTVTPPTRIMTIDQNGTAQATINNIVKLNPNTNQLQSTIPISDLSNYTFATRPKPSSPNCTEVLILKKLNQIEKSQLNKVATFATFPNLNFANNGIINNNNNSNVNLPSSDIIKISEVHSESPSVFQPEVHFADETNKKNENSNIKSETESSSQRGKKRKNERDLSPSSLRRINIVNELMALNSSHPVNESPVNSNCTSIPIQSALSSTNSTVQYSKAILMWDWNYRNVNEFPKYWGMIDSPEGVFFGYVGDVPSTITRSIFVNEDMTVELRANNHIAKSPLIEKIMNLQQLRIAMIKIVSMNLCSNSIDGHCENGFYLRKNVTASKKCKECQLKIYKEHSAQRRKNRRLIAQKERRTRNLRNIRQKLTRAVNRMEIMQKAYVELSSTLLPIE
ncbi:myb-like protein I isoform X2 [Leptopilina heterotoma]|uniref:myb-like protein I isoform X2 n=1 Tax=Leptopilina heterotoma TaxID=63436 RepID=UPI001CA95E86|nr:myb-like protein I isoform X2 [Leptopilina heterotoma]